MQPSFVALALLIANLIVTYQGLSSFLIMDQYSFKVDPILIQRDYKRMVTSGFLHVNWIHFGFNMLALVSFGKSTEVFFGPFGFLALYFAALVGGNLLALSVHRNHGDYSAVGASGAVSGVIFATILLAPDGHIGMMFLPLGLPSWLYGIVYLAGTMWGIKSQSGNIGHEAHLGGAVIGMLVSLIVYPEVALFYPITTILLIVPVVIFLIIIIIKPELIFIPGYARSTIKKPKIKKQKPTLTKEQELDQLLDKIQKKGIESLSAKERKKLDELSR